MPEIQYCIRCADKLWQYGEMPLHIYEQICEHYFFTNQCFDIKISLRSNFYTIIKFLESKGYIITTELDRSRIRIKPIGLKITSNDHHSCCHICLERDKHK